MRFSPDGTWLWDEDGFGMAELTIAPFFMRYALNEHYSGFTLPDAPEYARVKRYRDACLAHPVVRATGMSDEDFIKLYYDYSLGYGNGAVPEGEEKSSFDTSVPLAARAMPKTKRERWG
ncbi:hypothetical protein [Sandaracinus amylolyticus]|uniref:hypothetical protein n=1 Tax=Sandaracinus amylolyticus TaxID=927083 RepID=UPI001F3EDA69|nr:hypothetical protein [Sandaracinus amylolyticus]UJR81361.1 Hypothetical protein I5071_34180 [Sandaracinus amylolyticus]